MGDGFVLKAGPQATSGPNAKTDFPEPWLDYASTTLPSSLQQVLRWAEHIWLANGTYREACRRAGRYFITELRIKDVDDEVADEVRDIYLRSLNVKHFLSVACDNYLMYGNVFILRQIPFERFLQCSKCGSSYPMLKQLEKGVHWKWDNSKAQFLKAGSGCPACGDTHSQWKTLDIRRKDPRDMKLKIMNPHDMEIGYVDYQDEKEFYWNIPPHISTQVKRGVELALSTLDMEILEAVCCCSGKKPCLKLNSELVFHESEAAPAGLFTGGWGLPRVISNFRLAFHYQVLNRFDQAIALDYINGIRVISPDRGPGGAGSGGDPMLGLGGSQFNQLMKNMLDQHRRDPAMWQISGIPLQYQLFGAEGTQLSPREIKDGVLADWLDATGIPAELYKATLSVQAAPLAIRLFENNWPEIINLYNNILGWLASYLTQVTEIPEFFIDLMPPRLADDLERKAVMMQLMSGNQVSPQTALQAFGITDPREEIRRSYEFQRMMAEEEKKNQEELEQMAKADQITQEWAARSQGAPAGGPMAGAAGVDPSGGEGAGMPMDSVGVNEQALSSPEAMQAEADRMARELIHMEMSARRSTLVELGKTNETLHALVKEKIREYEQEGSMIGKQMLRQGQV